MEALVQEWGLDAGLHSKEEILAAIAARIDHLILTDFMGFIQLMYRLDIAEDRLAAVLDAEDAAHQVAALVWDRQLQKMISRKMQHRPPTTEEDLLL
ncbi:MAG: hypothetical protein JST36_02160 [Bacteroidetes bacterium]|nr:hypothetical protein [Bacteroidota bacterium]